MQIELGQILKTIYFFPYIFGRGQGAAMLVGNIKNFGINMWIAVVPEGPIDVTF